MYTYRGSCRDAPARPSKVPTEKEVKIWFKLGMDVGPLSTLLETKSPGHHLAVDVSIAVEHFTLFRTAEIELEIVFFRKTDTSVDLVRGGADATAGVARPGLGHGDFPGCFLPIGQTPRRSVGDEA